MKKEETVKMKFARDMFYDDPNVPLYDSGKVYDVPVNMKDRWIKRGGELVDEKGFTPSELEQKRIDADKAKKKPTDKVVEAEIDKNLAENLEDQGKISHDEVEQAEEKLEEVKEEVKEVNAPKHQSKAGRKK